MTTFSTQFQAYQRQYEDTLMHLFELNRPYLVDATIVDTDIKGMTKIFPRVGQLVAQKKTGRNERAILTEAEFSARHLTVQTQYVATPLDMEDVMKMVNNPQDDLYQETVHAIYNAQTSAVMDGFFQDVIINEDGGSTASFPSANQVAVNYNGGPFGLNSGAANTGLNIDKLLKIKSQISNAKILVNTSEMTTLNIAVAEDDVQSLLATKIGTDNFPLINRLETIVLELQEAAMNPVFGQFRWQGFTFHLIPRPFFVNDTSGFRRIPVWVKNGMVTGLVDNVRTEIERLPETVESVKIQALTRIGSLRKHDSKVYEIKVNN